MKKAIILYVCVGMMFCSIAQETPTGTSKPLLTKQEYLQKSQMQKSAGIAMVSVGGAMSIAGLVLVLITLVDKNSHDNTLLTTLIIAGPVLMPGSIGFFVPAQKNKRKALSVSFKNEPAAQLPKSTVIFKPCPSLTLKISL